MRSLARESVFKFLYSRLFNDNNEGLFDVLIKDLSDDDKQFATDLLKNVLDNESKYLQIIESLSIGFKLNRIFNLDKCALLIGLVELDYFKQTPTAVVVNEAVNLCAKYSTEKSVDFVNGILGEYVRKNGNNN